MIVAATPQLIRFIVSVWPLTDACVIPAPVPEKVSVSLFEPFAPNRENAAAPAANVTEFTVRLPFMSGVVRTLPANVRSVVALNPGVVFGFQFFFVPQKSSVPPPSHVCARRPVTPLISSRTNRIGTHRLMPSLSHCPTQLTNSAS